MLRDLADAARKEGAECHLVQTQEQKQQVAELVAEAEQFICAIRLAATSCEIGLLVGAVKFITPWVKFTFMLTAAAAARQFASIEGAAAGSVHSSRPRPPLLL